MSELLLSFGKTSDMKLATTTAKGEICPIVGAAYFCGPPSLHPPPPLIHKKKAIDYNYL